MPIVILIVQRYSPMSYRSYFLILFFSLIYSNFAYSILVTVDKFTRNGQTVYLLGDYHTNNEELAQEEKEQIDLVLRVLSERAQEKQRKIQILYEKASTTVHKINSRNWEPVYRFTINIDELLGPLNNPDITLHDIENRIVSGEIAFLFRCRGDLEYQDAYFDRDKAPKALKDITFKDLFNELASQTQALEEDIKNVPSEAERERCRERLNYCHRGLAFLNREIAQLNWPEDRPVIELAKNSYEDCCEEYTAIITRQTSRFLDASVGHQIIKSNPNEDIVVIAGAFHMCGIMQYMIGLGWNRDAHCGNIEREFLTQDEIDSVMRHKHLSERALLQLKELGAQAQRSVATTYATLSTYLKTLTGPSHEIE